MKRIYQLFVATIFALSPVALFSQITIDQSMTPEQLVQEVLLGGGVSVSNITFNGQPGTNLNNQIARYSGNSNFIDFTDGIILATADASIATGGVGTPQQPIQNDPDLWAIANLAGTNFAVNDNAILEFDFVPTGDSLQIRFVFASNEYTSFTCSSFNDPFGFFISGPGINGGFTNNGINIAVIPGTNIPITINSVNQGFPSGGYNATNCLNINPNYVADSQYYVSNSPIAPNDINFPGMTVTITAYAHVICGETYHIKIGVADVSDTGVDSAVFIEAASFQSNLMIDASLEIPVGVNDSTLYDGCGQAFLTFHRPGDTTLVETIFLEYSGDAVNGVHYSLLPDSIVFEENQSSVTFPLTVPPGADITGMMEAIVTITNIASECSGDVLSTEFSFWVSDVDPLVVEFEDVWLDDCAEEITIAPIPSSGYGVYTYDWSTGSTDPEITVSPPFTTTYTVTVGDTCGMAPVTGEITVHVPTYPDVTVDAGEDILISSCLELAELSGTISGGNGNYNFEWYNGDELIGNTQSMDYTPLGGTTTIYFVGSDACENSATDSLVISVPPVDFFVDAGPPLVLEHCFDSVLVQASIEGGVPGEVTYNWWSATTGGLGSGTDNSIWFGTQIESYVVVEAIDICGNTAVDSTHITIAPLEVIADAGADQTVNSCHTIVDLLGSATGGYGAYSYEWTGSEGQILGNEMGLSINPENTSTYTVTITDECGNFDQDDVTIYYELPELTLQMNPDTVVCGGGIANLWAMPDGGVPPYQYQWSGSIFSSPEITVQTYHTTQYTVTVADDCDASISGTTSVIVSDVKALFDINYGEFFNISVNNHSTEGQYLWDFGDGYTSTSPEPSHNYNSVQDFIVTLEVTDSLGCTDTLSVIAIAEGQLYIPNAFTPNEDGINDLFDVKGFNIERFEMVIVNRFGEEVFTTNSLDQKWDGSGPSQTHYSQNEVYVYSIMAETKHGTLIERQGTVTVMR